MHVILDYDVGNLDSVMRGFKRAGIDTVVSKDRDVIKQATSLILPGVGAFNASMRSLEDSGLIPLILDHVNQGKYLLGICLGMQVLFEDSTENGFTKGLGLFKGSIKYLETSQKVPHMGWNSLKFQRVDPILSYVNEQDMVYFVHSYYADALVDDVIAYADYDQLIPAIIQKDNIYAMQFHPEKSGPVGERLLKAYGELLR